MGELDDGVGAVGDEDDLNGAGAGREVEAVDVAPGHDLALGRVVDLDVTADAEAVDDQVVAAAGARVDDGLGARPPDEPVGLDQVGKDLIGCGRHPDAGTELVGHRSSPADGGRVPGRGLRPRSDSTRSRRAARRAGHRERTKSSSGSSPSGRPLYRRRLPSARASTRPASSDAGATGRRRRCVLRSAGIARCLRRARGPRPIP